MVSLALGRNPPGAGASGSGIGSWIPIHGPCKLSADCLQGQARKVFGEVPVFPPRAQLLLARLR
jgi:hypothetical protein